MAQCSAAAKLRQDRQSAAFRSIRVSRPARIHETRSPIYDEYSGSSIGFSPAAASSKATSLLFVGYRKLSMLRNCFYIGKDQRSEHSRPRSAVKKNFAISRIHTLAYPAGPRIEDGRLFDPPPTALVRGHSAQKCDLSAIIRAPHVNPTAEFDDRWQSRLAVGRNSSEGFRRI